MLSLICLALLPVVILVGVIYWQDKESPEPIGQLLLAVVYGVISLFLSFAISTPLQDLGFYPETDSSAWDGIRTAFFGAAIPEEWAKLAMLWLLLRRNKHFDEKLDGIVYAVCVSLGFAALENIMYLLDNIDDWVGVGIMRAIFSIPGHCCFGILMGYYYSLVKFSKHNRKKNMILLIVVPIVAHGVFDALLMMIPHISEALGGLLTSLFCVFCYYMWRYCKQQIEKHKQEDCVDRIVNDIVGEENIVDTDNTNV